MKKQINIFFVLFLLLLSFSSSWVKAGEKVAELRRGLALVVLKNSKITLELTQLISVTQNSVSFVNIDDFGNESFEVVFDKKKMQIKTQDVESQTLNSPFKKAMQIPLTGDEFLAIMHFTKPEKFKQLEDVDSITWQKPGYKKLKIRFEKFKALTSKSFPNEIRLEYKKNYFQIKWLKLQTSSKLP